MNDQGELFLLEINSKPQRLEYARGKTFHGLHDGG